MLVIANEQDSIISAAELEAFAGLHPASEYWVAPRTLHLQAHRQHADDYRDVVVGFLDRALDRTPGAVGLN
jgi:hypothetical protein